MSTKTILCRRCFQLFRFDEIGVLCRSKSCSRIPDLRGVEKPRYLRARSEGFLQRRRRSLDLEEAECRYCGQIGTLSPACPLCRRELDLEIGDVTDRVIAVIGASEAGKSHFLATVLWQLRQSGVGGDLWRVDMDREASDRYRRNMLVPLFEERLELPATPDELLPELRLTLENRRDKHKSLLVFRDLGGEIFRQPRRLGEMAFLRFAQGVVLLVDPLAFDSPAANNGEVVTWTPNRRPRATEILATYRAVLESQERYPEHRALPLLPRQKYLAVVVTKADLVLPRDHAFWSEEDTGQYLESGYWQRRKAESRAVQNWVGNYLSRELAEVADAFAEVSYFFASSYGFNHPPRSPLPKPPEPRRVHEPIFGLLDGLARAAPIGPAAEDEESGL